MTPATVLVVDDDPHLQKLMKKFLQLEGFTSVLAGNGQEALTYLRGGGGASCIVLDLRMPVMDGWAFRVEQRQDPNLRDIPVVVLSAAMDPAQEAARLGAIAGLGKPLDIARLLNLVAQYCPRRS